MNFSEKDVLKRAREILKKGPLPEQYAEHGEYCPWCALALAKEQLDCEHNQGVNLSECLRQLVTGQILELPQDLPLIKAKKAIGDISSPFTKTTTLAAIDKALGKIK